MLVRGLSRPIIATRNPPQPAAPDERKEVTWLRWLEPHRTPIDLTNVQDIDAVVHLMGEPIAGGRWTRAKKGRIRESRVESTRNLIAGIARLPVRPRVLVAASAMGYYGSRGNEELDEAASSGTDFLAGVCREWESAALAARELGVRVVLLRIGLVLGAGGFLAEVAPIFRRGLGGRLGHGRQWMSWIHVDDLVSLIQRCCDDSVFSGPVNASAPAPVRNAEFTRVLAAAVGKRTFLPVPRLALRILFGEAADVFLSSIRLRPAKALALGFEFRYPRLSEALAAALPAENLQEQGTRQED
jgi:hypothetical protein